MLLAIVITISSCSVSKKTENQEPQVLYTTTKLELLKQYLIDTLLIADDDKFYQAAKQFTQDQLNQSWEDGSNFLQYLVEANSTKRLNFFLNQRLSAYLDLKYHENLFEGYLQQSLSQNGKALFYNYKPSSLGATSEQALETLKRFHMKNIDQIYGDILEQRIESANLKIKNYSVTCDAVVYSILLKFQAESKPTNNNIEFSAIQNFFKNSSCNFASVSPQHADTLWKMEIQRQFRNEFKFPDLLEELHNAFPGLPTMISIGNIETMATIKALYTIANVCQFSPYENKSDTKVFCVQEPIKPPDYCAEPLKYSSRFLKFLAENYNFMSYASQINDLLEIPESKRPLNDAIDLFLKKVGVIDDGNIYFTDPKPYSEVLVSDPSMPRFGYDHPIPCNEDNAEWSSNRLQVNIYKLMNTN